MKNRYLLLYPDTFLWCNEEKGLLYNAKSGYSYFFNKDKLIGSICDKLLDANNLYVCKIQKEESKEELLKEWLKMLCRYKMGEIVDTEDCNIPISFPPILNLQSDVTRIEKEPGRNIGENVLSYLTNINLYIGGYCNVDNNYCKQTLFPYSDEMILFPESLIDFVRPLQNLPIRMNVIGGNILRYPYYDDLFKILDKCSFLVDFYVFDSSFCELLNMMRNKDISYRIIYTNYNIFREIVDVLNVNMVNYSVIYTVSSIEDLQNMSIILELIPISNIEVIPIYLKIQENFFQNNVYTSIRYLNRPQVDKQYIYRNSVVNSNFWGKITILPNGKVYSNLSLPSLGTISETPYEILIRELKMINAWRFTRDKCKPCCSCLFKYICPPISSYELVIGRNNLCHVFKR